MPQQWAPPPPLANPAELQPLKLAGNLILIGLQNLYGKHVNGIPQIHSIHWSFVPGKPMVLGPRG